MSDKDKKDRKIESLERELAEKKAAGWTGAFLLIGAMLALVLVGGVTGEAARDRRIDAQMKTLKAFGCTEVNNSEEIYICPNHKQPFSLNAYLNGELVVGEVEKE